jgi:hypothetical protein
MRCNWSGSARAFSGEKKAEGSVRLTFEAISSSNDDDIADFQFWRTSDYFLDRNRITRFELLTGNLKRYGAQVGSTADARKEGCSNEGEK